MKRYDVAKPWARAAEQPQPAGPPPGAELETSTPTRPASFTADLVVPLGQAAVTGALVGAVVVFLAGEVAPGWEVDRIKLWGGVALAIAALAWLLLLADTRRLLWSVEKLTGLDLDKDGATGKPQERIVVVNAAQAKEKAAEAETSQRQSDFARFVAQLEARGTDARTWEPELGRATYQHYRDTLIKLRWARWNSTKKDGTPNERRGWGLARPAAEILERIG